MQDAILGEIFSLLQRAPREPGTGLSPGAGQQDILDFESKAEIQLPDALKSILHVCNGAVVGPGGIYGIPAASGDSCPRSYSISDVLDLHPQWRQLGWIPVAGDGCGNEHVLALRAKGHPVLFVETCTNSIVARYAVGSGLWRSLRFLLQEELRQRGWPFIKEHVLRLDPELERVLAAPMPWDVANTP